MRILKISLLLLIAGMLCPVPIFGHAAGDEDHELVKEFKKFYHPKKSMEEKIETIYVLKEAAPFESTQVLVKVFDDPEPRVVQAAIETIGSFRDKRITAFLIENYLLNKREKKKHRITAAVDCLGRMEDKTAVEPMIQIFGRAKKWELRKTLGVALGRLKDPRGLPVLAELLNDDDPSLRVIAVQGLVWINEPDAPVGDAGPDGEEPLTCKEAIVRVLEEDRTWQVRASAIEAVRKMRFREGIQPLITRMRVEQGRLRQDAYEALKEITFAQCGDDPEEWQKYWDRVGERFEVPDYNLVMEARKKREIEGSRYSEGTPGFVGIKTKSKRIIFVIDISRSMEAEVLDVDRFKARGRDYKSFMRLEIVKDELMRTVAGFDSKVEFNILAFATNLKWWKKDLVPSNILNRKSAVDFIKRLEPIGGGSAGFKVRAGLRAEAILKEGMTNTYGALMAALGVPEDFEESAARKTFNNEVDTIYFLSDGEPTTGLLLDQEEIREAVAKVNKIRKITLHTIAIGDFRKTFLKRLAQDNGGVYVDLGK